MKRNANIRSDRKSLLAALRNLRQEIEQEGRMIYEQWLPGMARREFRTSALNLAYYIALRRRNLSGLQATLLSYGLAPLAHCESRVLQTLDAIIAACAGTPTDVADKRFFYGQKILDRRTNLLFGPLKARRRTRIMVTLATDAAGDYPLIRDLIVRGMNCARINCAHDSEDVWEAMVAHVRRAANETGRICRILMDVAGPKPRTDAVLTPGPKNRLFRNSYLLLTREPPQSAGGMHFQTSCTMPEVISLLKVGTEVWIDDGRIGARVEALTGDGALLKVISVRATGERLQSGKGINLPNTRFEKLAFTDKDRRDLQFVCAHADILGYSFVQNAADVAALYQEMETVRTDKKPCQSVVLKIETRKAMQNLPDLIVAAAGRWQTGIMIARGDLGVELSLPQLIEVQDQILSIGQAASVPVIWATQVLDRYTKKGVLTRAEATDTAMGGRAECVMLNKGPFIKEAVSLLDNLLFRAQSIRNKNLPNMSAIQFSHQADLTCSFPEET